MELKMELDPTRPVSVKKEEDHPDLDPGECKMEVDPIEPVSVKKEEPEDIKPCVNSARIISIKHEEAEDCKDLNIVVCKEEVSLTQERIPGAVKEEPQPPQIKEEPVEILLISEGPDASTMPPVKIEVADEVADGNMPSHSSESDSEASEEGDEWEASSDDYTFVPVSEIKPYMFEPECDSESEDGQSGQDEDSQQQRLQQDVSAWCTCGKCSKMQTAKANICCQEIPKVVRRMNDVPNTTCMTDHPGFEVICLNGYQLQNVHNMYKVDYGRVKRKTEGELQSTTFNSMGSMAGPRPPPLSGGLQQEKPGRVRQPERQQQKQTWNREWYERQNESKTDITERDSLCKGTFHAQTVMENKPRNAYDADFKLKAVNLAVKEGNRAASRTLGINESMVRRWRRQSEELSQCKKSKKAFRGNKSRWPELEDFLEDWLNTQRADGRGVSTVQIRLKAKTVAAEMKIEHFRGGPSWCFRFMRRKGLSIR